MGQPRGVVGVGGARKDARLQRERERERERERRGWQPLTSARVGRW